MKWIERQRAMCVLGVALALFVAREVVAEFPRVAPTPPERAESTFEVLHGFRMELIAAEPLVASPVDLAYDEDGRAYVVEMRDYPFPEEKNAAPSEFPGTVRLLVDADGDGKFDKATIFADQLAWPTSVCCYKGGVFVAAAPDVWYFKDTDGDGKADVRRKVFTGFSRYNVQAIMNSLRWGLDSKIYGAASGNGGTVRHAERPDDPVVQLTRRDFRFDPGTEKIEAISGGERYGACFDDWGNRFLCNIRNPVQHVVLPLHYLARNPHLVVPSVIQDCAESGDQLRVYRISPPEPWREFRAQRWALEGANMPRSELIGAGFWTSSSGVCVYRGGAYPEQFRGNVFVGEVAGNLVHRQVLERDGVTFRSRRADENTEFVRSRDNWFRPVNFVNAPDGTLTVLDMYRETIEHPWSIPDDIKAQLDLSSGKERGRLYRLTPPEFKVPRQPRLSQCTTAELVAHLESPHSWYRETAQRLLVERQDKEAVEPLRKLAHQSNFPQTRINALYATAALTALTEDDLKASVNDPHYELRRHAVMLSERHLRESEWYSLLDATGKSLEAKILHHCKDIDPVVRFQIALTLCDAANDGIKVRGNLAQMNQVGVSMALSDVARLGANDPWTRAAIVSSSRVVAPRLIKLLTRNEMLAATEGRAALLRDLAFTVGSDEKDDAILEVLGSVPDRAVLMGIGQGLARRRKKLSDFVSKLPHGTREEVQKTISDSVMLAADTRATIDDRLKSLQLLTLMNWGDVRSSLVACLAPLQPRDVQHAALRVLSSFNESAVSEELLSRWKQLTPPVREEAVNVLLSRPIWHEALIAAMEKGEVPIAQVSIPQRTRLAAIRDEKLAERAKKVLASFVVGPRKEVIDRYQEAVGLKGEAAKGQVVYRRECMNCHKLRGEGHDVGPSLETIQHRSPQEILVHVLDPNREVSPNFLEYVVRLADGRVLTGLIAGETDAGLTLKRAQNQEDSILRSEIEEMASSGKSLMPEGMEQKISLQEMADLVAFLKQN